MDPITHAFVNLITSFFNGISDQIQPVITMIVTIPPQFTTENQIVATGWTAMTAVADTLLALYVTMKALQMMYGQATGTIHVPPGQFIAKAFLTAILIHASFFIGQELITFNNLLSGLVQFNTQMFIRQVNGNQLLNNQQSIGLSIVLTIVFGFSLFRVILQAIKRVAFFNVLFVLSGPAFLMSLDAQSAPWFSFWLRTYLVTVFEQFFQFLTLELGFQFLLATNQPGFTSFIIAIAMLNLTAEIPGLLSRFATSAGSNVASIGGLMGSAIKSAALFL